LWGRMRPIRPAARSPTCPLSPGLSSITGPGKRLRLPANTPSSRSSTANAATPGLMSRMADGVGRAVAGPATRHSSIRARSENAPARTGNLSTPKNVQKLQKGVARESQGRSLLEAFEHTITHRAPNKPPNLAATCSGVLSGSGAMREDDEFGRCCAPTSPRT
jgi:hypothetical protein